VGGRLGTVHETGKGFLGHGLGDPLISWKVDLLNIKQEWELVYTCMILPKLRSLLY
jgi:hypothetical protein